MSEDLVSVSGVSARYTSTGKLSSYAIECRHSGLKEHREIKSSDPGVLGNKVQAVLEKWEQKWQKTLVQHMKIESGASADAATEQAQRNLGECERLLQHTLGIDDRVDWGLLKLPGAFVWTHNSVDHLVYADDGEPRSKKAVKPPIPPSSGNFVAELGFLDRIIPALRKKKEAAADERFREANTKFSIELKGVEQENALRQKKLEDEKAKYLQAKDVYSLAAATASAKVDELRSGWREKRAESVIEHAELVLNSSRYPDWFKSDFEVGYLADAGMLIVDFELPDPEAIPTLERVTYVKARHETTEKHLTDAKRRLNFDSICYQVALRTLHELFEADEVNALASVTFNGWVEATNKATGRLERACILSVQAVKAEFLTFDLAKVNPKACFQSLKGVAASSLSQLAAVRPIIRLDRNDSRFVESHDVAHTLDESTNLATMGWEDFEHLVRELFGKVFSGPGAEVMVTQASRDGGVDAIALDPDPIKGGKIVIQAKRYSGTVGVSAVRDLYGTVMNEGANRGILVTTSNFGPDAYKFATGKPITLLNGSNLLSLLADHGHKAKIDLAEAKRLLQPQQQDR